MNILLTKRALAPIITVIILIVIGTIVVIGVLSWGKNFTTDSLSKTTSFGNLSVSDAESFIYLKGLKDGVLAFNYNPPDSIKDEITITHYKLANISGMTPIELETPVTLTPNSQNVIYLDCLYAYSVTGEVKLKLITSDNKSIDLTARDTDLICTSSGSGSLEDPVVLCSAEDLNNIRNALDLDYKLGKDIDLKCLSRESEEGFVPIGNGLYQFIGSLDGSGYTISNLYINASESSEIGLFGFTSENAALSNINLEDINISGSGSVGGLVGYNSSNISNCYSSGFVSGDSYIGGLIGYNSGAISNSHSTGTVSGDYYIGGLVGDTTGQITNSYSTGAISGGDYTGGLVGYNESTMITNSYSTGAVSGGDYIGGLVGSNQSADILNSYSTGEVSGHDEVGGLVGNFWYSSISNSYSTGAVSGNDAIGGLVGYSEYGAIDNSYSTGDASGNYYIGGLIGKASGGEISDSNSSGDTIGADAVGCLIGAVNSEAEPDILDSNGTGSYECTGEECSAGCPIGDYFMIH
jgi:hypothetical protein